MAFDKTPTHGKDSSSPENREGIESVNVQPEEHADSTSWIFLAPPFWLMRGDLDRPSRTRVRKAEHWEAGGNPAKGIRAEKG